LPDSGLATSKALFLSAKQQIPIFTCPVPPHPGTKPIEHGAALLRWKEKANAYAHYFLMMYWPEPLTKQNTPLEYTWNTFEEWINKKQESNTAFGICHLMMMHRCMQTTYTDNQMQQIFNDYCSAPRDLWSLETRNHIATIFQMEYRQKNEDIDDQEWNLSNSKLSLQILKQLQKLLKFSNMQLKSLEHAMPSRNNWNTESRTHSASHNDAPCTNPSELSPPLQAKQVQLCFQEIHEDDQLNKGQTIDSVVDITRNNSENNGTAVVDHVLHQQPTLDTLIEKYFLLQPTTSQLEFFSLYAQYFLHPEDATY